MRKLWLAAVVAVGVSSLALPHARAADDDGVVRQLADVSFQAGVRWFKQGDFQRAFIEFSKANAVYPRGSTMRNLGLCELKLGKPLDALRHFRAAAQAPDTKPEQRDLAKQDVADAYALTGHILPRSKAVGATVLVDDVEVGRTPLGDPIDVLPGHHVVEGKLDSRSSKVDVEAVVGQVVEVEVSPPVPPPPAVVQQPAPSSSTAPPEQPSQQATGGFWTTRREVGLGVAGGGAIALIIGEVFHAQADSAKDRAAAIIASQSSSACAAGTASSACSQLTSTQSEQQRDATLSVTFWVISGVALAAGAAMTLWPASTPSSTHASIAPLASPHGGGLQLQGEF